ncbi:TatD family hydrolase [Candidatus Avoscillospira sp. LCP25S3_F1]|uniref:TatD family hydrolase n=1 Tax=Candidatus Avoscillospira sp. LCP25S3_F1 TaxID=3438825 RepID=UPI003F916123
MLFDTHAHYDAKRFDNDRHELLASMQQNGVGRILNAGCDLESSRMAIELAHQYNFIYAAVGSHPDDADHVDGALVDTYRELAKEDKVVAIGEIGLDYYYEDVPREQQKKAFRMQMELARALHLPVIVHERDAHGDGLEIVKEFPDVTGVFHCYSGSLEMARELVKLGWYVGFTGVLTFKNARKALEVAENVPLHRIVLETDCPYMAPEPYRGKRCDSTMLPRMAEKLAQLRDKTVEEIEQITWENGCRLFRLKP